MRADRVDPDVRAAVWRALEWRGGLPATKRRLAGLAGVNARQVEAAIQAMRRDGRPIASGQRGYWIARSPEDLEATMEHLKHRLKEQYRTWKGVRRARAALLRRRNLVQRVFC